MKDEKSIIKMLDLIKKIEHYCNGVDFKTFSDNEMLTEACVFNLVQLGETSHKVSDELEELHPEIAWRELNGLRNRLVHDYQGVNLKLVWEIISDDLPNLKTQLSDLL